MRANGAYARFAKPFFDRSLSLVLVVLLAPAMVLIALGVRVFIGSPVLERIALFGLGGRRFTMYKFRTATGDADAGSINSEISPLRPTNSFGRFLRRWTLDELPQLFNVVRGEMSFVGPRATDGTEYDRSGPVPTLSVRPGITGHHQVAIRIAGVPQSEAGFMDVEYANRMSFAFDLGVLLATPKTIIGSGRALRQVGGVYRPHERLDPRAYLFSRYSPREVAARAATDLFLANAGFLAGISLAMGSLSDLSPTLGVQIVILNVLGGTAVLAFGVYGRLAPFRLFEKTVRLFIAFGLAGAIHVGLLVLFTDAESMTRGAVALGWIGAALATVLVRYAKAIFELRYAVAPRHGVRSERATHVLVIGGAGYIGAELVRQLLVRGYQVRVLDKLIYGDLAIRDLYENPHFELEVGDFREVNTVVQASRGVDAVIHLGAIVGDPACEIDRKAAVEINFEATRMIRDVARGMGIKRFVFASTCSVYGEGSGVSSEDSELNPVSIYAWSKIASERAILEVSDEEFQPTVLRLATIFGWGARPRFDLVVNLLTAKAVLEGSFQVFNGDQWRPFIHVRDASQAFLRCLEAPLDVVGGEVFNVGDDELNRTISGIGELIKNQFPRVNVEEVTNEEDRRDYNVSFEKIRTALGFHATVTLEEGIDELHGIIVRGRDFQLTNPVHSNVAFLRERMDRIAALGDRHYVMAEDESYLRDHAGMDDVEMLARS